MRQHGWQFDLETGKCLTSDVSLYVKPSGRGEAGNGRRLISPVAAHQTRHVQE
jgi:nitrite reductase/ring-hydroxylating ferredoxin subunit